MPDPVAPADLSRISTGPLAECRHKVRIEQFAIPPERGGSAADLLAGLPDVLAVRELRGLAESMLSARARGRRVHLALGAHVLKVGLSPIVVRWMELGVVNGISLNGAGAIHDFEIAAVGATSEDVDETLHDGRFGMARETGVTVNTAAAEAAREGAGLGPVLGRRILEAGLPHAGLSVLARAFDLGVPATVHVALGCDVVHVHPDADGAAIGAATFTDFRRLIAIVGELSGGVWVNVGSATQLPEVFLKAIAASANLGRPVTNLVTADLDMVRHYRPEENVLRRPTAAGGRSHRITGHHELTVPLLAAILAELSGTGAGGDR